METLFAAFTALTLFGSAIWFWVFAVTFVIVCFVSETTKNGVLAFGTLVALTILVYFKGSVDPLLEVLTLRNVSIYLALGLFYSMLRTFFEARKLGNRIKDFPETKKEAKERNLNQYETKESEKKDFIERLKGNVFRWWFMWFISLITWMLTDIVKDVYDYVYSKLAGVFKWVVDLGVKSVK